MLPKSRTAIEAKMKNCPLFASWAGSRKK